MAHFYLKEALESADVGDIVTVDGPEARHAVTVGRMRAGETTSVGNGAGLVTTGPVVSADQASFSIRVASVDRHDAPSPAIWLAQALAKGDRDELAIQAATELGLDGVIPWAAERSIVRWSGAKQQKHQDRWASILREATKQSLRPTLPQLLPLASTKDLTAIATTMQTLVLEPTAVQPLTSVRPDGRPVLLVVGPEGGISPAELAGLDAAGATAVRLGDTVLRTSTAGPAALAVLNGALGRW